MATELKLRNTRLIGAGAALRIINDFSTTFGVGGVVTYVVNTAASGTDIKWTIGAGNTFTAEWISGRVPSGGFTLTTATVSLWLSQSMTTANIKGRIRLFKLSGSTETELAGGPFDDDIEPGTSLTEMTWTANVTDTAFAENDRLLMKIYITNNGTMGGSLTATIGFDEASGATGDSFISLNETVAFKAEDNFSGHVLILHGDGDDASTTITDSSTRANTVVAVGNAQLDTAQSKFGASSFLFDGTGDYLRTHFSQDYAFLDGDFTIDCWIRRNTTGAQGLFTTAPSGEAGGFSGIGYAGVFINASNVLIFDHDAGDRITGTTAITADSTWHHVALTRSGTDVRLFLDGTQEGSTFTISRTLLCDTGGMIWGARNFPSTPSSGWNGWIDEIHIERGVAEWTANFTPPTVPWSTSTAWSGEATFAGAGGMSARANMLMQAAATLPGAGGLSARANMRMVGAATFAGAGDLSAQTIKYKLVEARFAGAGGFSADAVTVTSGATYLAEATFQGSGSLSALAQQAHAIQATLQGAGDLSAYANLRMVAAATFSGAGDLSAQTLKYKFAEATFQGSGSLSADAFVAGAGNVYLAEATFEGSGTLSARAHQAHAIQATFPGVGGLSAYANARMVAFSTFQGSGSFSAHAQNFKTVSATFQGTGSLSAEARQAHAALATFQGAGSLSAQANMRMRALATFGGTGSLSADTLKYKLAQATFQGAGGLSAYANLRMRVNATFQGTGNFSAEATIAGQANVWPIEATFVGAGGMSVEARLRQAVAANFAGAGGLQVTARMNMRAAARFEGAGTLQAYANLRQQVSARFEGAGTLTADATVPVSIQLVEAVFAGAGGMSVDAIVIPGVPPAPVDPYPRRFVFDDYGMIPRRRRAGFRGAKNANALTISARCHVRRRFRQFHHRYSEERGAGIRCLRHWREIAGYVEGQISQEAQARQERRLQPPCPHG